MLRNRPLGQAAFFICCAFCAACTLILALAVECSADNAITSVKVVNTADKVVITVRADAPLKFVPLVSAAGKYIGFQFPCALRTKGGAVPIRSGGIYSVRYSNFQAQPPVSRVVVNTTKHLKYSTQRSEDGKEFEICVFKAVRTPLVRPASAAGAPSVIVGNSNSKPVADAKEQEARVGADSTDQKVELPAQQSAADRLWAYKAIAERSRLAAQTARQADAPIQVASASLSLPASPENAVQPLSRVPGSVQTTGEPDAVEPSHQPADSAESLGSDAPRRVALANPGIQRASSPERKVSVNFLGADINDVLKALSVQSGKNIVSSKDVTGNVTVSLSNVSLEEALDYVTKLSGYTYTKDGDTYLVSTKESLRSLTGESSPDAKTELVKLSYAKADDVVALLKSRFPDILVSKVGVEPAPKAAGEQPGTQSPVGQKNNLLVLSGPAESVAEARKLAEQFEQTLRVQAIQSTRATYRVKFASPSQLAQTLMALVPGVEVVFAPTSDFELVRFKSAKTSPGQAPQVEREFDTAGNKSTGDPSRGAVPGAGADPTGKGGGPAGPVTNARTIVIVGDEQSVAKALEIAQQLDVKAPQIKIDAKISSINKTGEKKLGLEWQWGDLVVLEGFTDYDKTTDMLPTGDNKQNVRIAHKKMYRQPWDFAATLDALVTSGDAQVLASPSIVCLERNPGVFFVGDEVTYVQRVETTPTGQNILTDTKRVGVQMVVAGEINDDGYITLYLHPEVSTLKLSVEQGVALPIVSSRFTDHVVRVKSGQTIVIGGLIRSDEVEEMRKVPFLGDLPLFGQLFRHTQKTKDETEVVMFITASILQD
ncbi:MAG: secretin and TonB N-terminal domain-containing protein [Armatimonadota bacterium]|nr:secretin and TonB N-terminal domain-containing protein [Armatimonadota bacterium]